MIRYSGTWGRGKPRGPARLYEKEDRGKMRYRRDRKKTGCRGKGLAAVIMTVLSLSACTLPFTGQDTDPFLKEDGAASQERADTGFVVPGPESFDSADTAVLVGVDGEEGTVTLLNLELGRNYTLAMDGTTRLYDKYGDAVSIGQIEKGDIVDVTFLKSKKHLTTMRQSVNSWTYADVERYEVNPVRGEVTIGQETFKLTSNTQYLSEGMKIELMDLNPADTLSFQGIGNQILSGRVEKGHGYLRLEGDEKFVGGWIEVGQSVIQRITEDMLLVVAEGDYQVNISHKGGGGVKSVRVDRNQETLLDISDLEIPEPQTGTVLFSVNPADAELYVDGGLVDASVPQTLEYGLHQLIARAEGYHSITQYIRVAQESLAFELTLEEADAGESQEPSDSDSSTVPTDTTTDYYKVYVDAPEGAEVYLDGSYVGIAPCSFRKVEGAHTIILRKAGHETRSYTIQVDNEEKDISFSFADLAAYATESTSSQESSKSSQESSKSSQESEGSSQETKESSGESESASSSG